MFVAKVTEIPQPYKVDLLKRQKIRRSKIIFLLSRLSLFGHIARMDESTDASRILFEPPSEVWRKPRGRPRNSWVPTVTNTWQTPTVGFRKQERQLRTGYTGGCLWSIAQRTRSGACSYWIGHGLLIQSSVTIAMHCRSRSLQAVSQSQWPKVGLINDHPTNRRLRNWRMKMCGKLKNS